MQQKLNIIIITDPEAKPFNPSIIFIELETPAIANDEKIKEKKVKLKK